MRFLAAARLLLTLRCEQSTRIVSDSLDRDLSAVEMWAVRLHYVSCWSCRRFGRQVRELRDALRQSPTATREVQLSPETLQRIRDAIQQAE